MPAKRKPTSRDLEALRRARLHEVELRCEKLRRELALSSREVLTVKEVSAALASVARAMRTVLVARLEVELPGALEGRPAAEIRPLLRNVVDELCGKMADLERLLPVKLHSPNHEEKQTSEAR